MDKRDLDMSDVIADGERMRDEQAQREQDEHQKAHEDLGHPGCETCAAGKLEAGYNEIVTVLEEAGYKIEHLADGILNVIGQDERYVNTVTITRTPGY